MTKKRVVVFASFALACILSFATAIGLMFAKAESITVDSKKNVFTVKSGEISLEAEIEDKYYTNTITGSSTNGILIAQKNASIDFAYNNAIDLTNYTKENPIIEFYALNAKEGVSMIDNLTITLTDAYNSANTVSVYAYTDYSNNAMYTRVRYRGLDRAGITTIRDGAYGVYVRNTGLNYSIKRSGDAPFVEWSADNKVHPISFSLDYDEKIVYMIYQNGGVPQYSPILDLDSTFCVGAGLEWEGFTKGRAKLSVTASFLSDSLFGGVIVKSVAGSNLEGEFVDNDSFPAPKIDLDKYSKSYFINDEKRLPNGTKGCQFRLPNPFAFDWYYGINEDIETTVHKTDGTFVKKIDSNYSFLPEEAGEYYVEYVVSNAKKTSSEKVYFTIDEQQLPITIVMLGDFDTDELMTTVTVPETEFFGGSGKIIKEEKLYYNGKEIEITPDRKVFLNKVGTLVLEVMCTPYSGEIAKKTFSLIIEGDTVLNVSGVPRAITKGKTIILPQANAYNSETGEKASVKIYVDSEEVGSDRSFTATTVGTVNVKYVAETELGIKEKNFKVDVLPTVGVSPKTFFLSDGSVAAEDSKDGVKLTSSIDGATANFAFPVVTRYSSSKMYMIISGIQEKANFEYLDILFTDYNGNYGDKYIRIKDDPSNKGNSLISYNGSNESYSVSGSLSDASSLLVLYVSGNKLYYSYSAQYVCDLAEYDADLSYISFRFGGVKGESGLLITTLSNQAMVKKEGVPWKDQIAPVLSFESQFEKYFNATLNSVVTVPATKAYDMLSETASVSLKVVNPNGKTVFSTDDLSQKNTFKCSSMGEYQINFIVSDAKNTSTIIYKCTVTDNVTPSMSISGKINSVYKVNSVVKLPSATAKDNVDGGLKVYVRIRHLADYTVIDALAGESVKLTKTGDYEIIYYAHDTGYNYVSYVFKVRVGEKR